METILSKEKPQEVKLIKVKRKPIEIFKIAEGLFQGTLKDGKKYSVRENRDRYFFPNEWMKFYDSLRKSQKMTFDILINTGARFNEVAHIKVGDIDFERGNIILRKTKIKAREGERNPRPRIISISNNFSKRLHSYVKQRKLSIDNYLGLLSRPATHLCLKNHLKAIGIVDYYMISIHNIRKTHGNWLKALGIDAGEICTRLGHTYAIFLKHYASSNIFNFRDLQNMRLVLGDLYQKK